MKKKNLVIILVVVILTLVINFGLVDTVKYLGYEVGFLKILVISCFSTLLGSWCGATIIDIIKE